MSDESIAGSPGHYDPGSPEYHPMSPPQYPAPGDYPRSPSYPPSWPGGSPQYPGSPLSSPRYVPTSPSNYPESPRPEFSSNVVASGGFEFYCTKPDKLSFEIESDTITIIHPHDENPLSENNKQQMSQYMHGGVNVSGEKISVGFVFRVVNETYMHDSIDDIMVYHNFAGHGNIVTGILGIGTVSFYWDLSNLYRNTL